MTPTETLQAVCEAWNRLDNDALADLFAEDGLFEDPLNERAARGREDVRAIVTRRRWQRSRSARSRSPRSSSAATWAWARACSARRSPTAAARFDFPFAMAIEVRDGRIARLSEYFDTAPLV